MKINLLYIIWLVALLVSAWIVRDFMGQSEHTFFATAETEPLLLNAEYPTLVQNICVEVGKYVKKGDTLAILSSTDFDKTSAERRIQILQYETEKSSKNEILKKDIELFLARQTARTNELKAQIKVLETEEAIQNSLKSAIFEGKNDQKVTVKKEQIAGLTESIRQVEVQTQEQLKQYEAQRQANENITHSKITQLNQDLNFIHNEKGKLIMLAPIEGYIEQILVSKNTVVPQYKEMFKINPKKPNKIIGFIHEMADIPFQLGDTVRLASSARPTISIVGRLIGSNPKLVELPIRLRKFMEVRAWGREVFIELPDSNQFYIGEKIVVTLPTKN